MNLDVKRIIDIHKIDLRIIEIEDEKGDSGFPIETYPTFMVRINDKMVETITGYAGKEKMEAKLNSY